MLCGTFHMFGNTKPSERSAQDWQRVLSLTWDRYWCFFETSE